MRNNLFETLVLNKTVKDLSNPWVISDIVVCIILVFLVSFFMCWKLRRVWLIIGYSVLGALFVVSLFLVEMEYLPYLTMALIAVLTIVCLMMNSDILRKYLAKSLKSKNTSTSNNKFDKEQLISNIVTAVTWLSENKVGAIITFERDTPLDDFIKNGSIINCPVTPEIIETIFYEGTRLHDGAIVIRDDTIVAAAVFYTPTSKAVHGKFGARHRAAVGISEMTDAFTIIVSEETGRISATYNGVLDNIKTPEFEGYFRKKYLK